MTVQMTVRQAMNPVTVTVGSGHTMREAARRMTEGRTGAAVVIDHELPAPGIVTERDVLRCAGQGGDLDGELVGHHLTAHVVYAAPDWPLARAAEQMTLGGFRHVLVMDGPELVGILSMRDIVGHWVHAAVPQLSMAVA
jgi:CBS domain-containing protein